MVDAALEVREVLPIIEYVQRQQATVSEYVTGRHIYGLCTGAERIEGFRRFLRCSYQEYCSTQAEKEVE